MPALTSGDSLGPRYILIRRLGAGGMGEVWLVEDRELQIELAAKIVQDPSAGQIERLRREWRLAGRLNHPGVVRVFDFEQRENLALLTMEFVEGRNLGDWLGAPPAEIVELLIPVAEALDYAHRSGVVHRDVKLSNVIVDRQGRPRLLDFGISELANEGSDGGGSPASASPQQIQGAPAHRSDDIYGFGTLLYELLSGKPPFWPDLAPERIVSSRPGPLHAPHPLPAGLQELVDDLLEKRADDRPGTLQEVGARLRALLRPETEADAEPSTRRPGAGVAESPTAGAGEIEDPATRVRLTPPPKIQPRTPDADAAGSAAPPPVESRERTLRWATGIAFAVLAVAAITVFAVLPDWVAAPQDPAAAAGDAGIPALGGGPSEASTASETPPAEPSADPEELAAEAGRSAAERLRRLESRAASIWAGEDFATAKAEIRKGDQRLLEGDIEAAASSFEHGLSLLEDLEAQASPALDEALSEGRSAVARGDSATAQDAFELAVRIDPGNSAAVLGLRQAAALPSLLARLDAGAERQRRGDLQGALGEYRQAAKIDPGSSEARSAIDRLTRQIEESGFSGVMAEGFAALESGAFAEALASFQQAKSMRPASAEASDGIDRAKDGLRTAAISDHRGQAEAAVAAEDWHTAARHYGQILELDPTPAFAQQGLARSRGRAELADQLATHLQHRKRMSEPGVLSEARATLDEATSVADPGPRLERQIRELEEWVVAYSTPLTVVLESDELTEVEIYRIGPQGSFSRRRVELLPGGYTVIGRRSGYQDVRIRLEILPGEEPEPVTIRCEAEI